MNINLDNASAALTSLKDPKSAAPLGALHQSLEQFRKSLGIGLNDAEFRYVMQTLFNDQIVTVKPDSALAKMPAVTLASGFTIKSVI